MTEKEFKIGEFGITMGTLLCSYLYEDQRVCNAGYKTTRDGNLVIKIKTHNESPDLCVEDAIKKCREELNNLMLVLN